MKIDFYVTNALQFTFGVRILREGDSWGATNKLKWSGGMACEFWDVTHANCNGFREFGQCCARYPISTFDDPQMYGLKMSESPDWWLDADALQKIRAELSILGELR